MKKLAVFALAFAICSSVFASCEQGYCFQPYIGADAQVRNGFNVSGVKKSPPQMNIYGGLKIGDYVGIELGAHATRRIRVVGTGITPELAAAGYQQTAEGQAGTGSNVPYGHQAKLKAHAVHLSLVGFIPLGIAEQTDFLIGAGLSNAMIKLSEGPEATIRRTIPRAFAGLQIGMAEGLSLRPAVTWENTKKIRHSSINHKDSFHYGVGLNYKF